MSKVKNLLGQRFGRLVVIERAEKINRKDTCAYWRCRCDCGNEIVVSGYCLRRGNTSSCGCSRKGINFKHGKSKSNLYPVWAEIKDRTSNPNNPGYKNYGRRGISIYNEWIDSFQAFYEYVSKLEHFGEPNYSLDRINNDGNYEPGNLRFADRKTQSRNTRRTVIVEYNGETMCLKDASKASGINYGTIISRYHAGDRDDRLFRPVAEDKKCTKLNKESVKQIRNLYSSGAYTQAELAKKFGVSTQTICNVVNQKIWKSNN